MTWDEVLSSLPLIAILRGVTPAEAPEVAEALFDAGFVCVEVTLNSPSPLQSITAIRSRFNARMLVGAGTVLTAPDVQGAADAGAQVIISPNSDRAVIEETKAAGLVSLPAFLTPTEAFMALASGADALKFFPAETASPAALKAMRAVLPPEVKLFPVGGIEAEGMAPWRAAGAAGFGVGGAVYRPGMSPDEVRTRAAALVEVWRGASFVGC